MDKAEKIPNDIRSDLTGEFYLTVLGRLHARLRPKTYFEIGTRDGASLKLSQAKSIAVDPNFNLDGKFLGDKPLCALYRMTSDRFFEDIDPKLVVGGPVDFAFLDGLHLAEFLLRDFMNIEKHVRKNSIIAIHDCIPVELAMARRVESVPNDKKGRNHPNSWTGDVWKLIPILKHYRPDLKIMAVDAAPTGLILVMNCDRNSRVLEEKYSEILEKFSTQMDASQLVEFVTSLDLVSTSTLNTFEDIGQFFWL